VSPIQDFEDETRFDLISSVTVIQHNPPDEQHRILEHLRSLARPGAHFIMLENIRDQHMHVWAHSIDEWTALAKNAGFQLQTVRRYDYNPLLSLRGPIRRQAAKILGWDKTTSPKDMADRGRRTQGDAHSLAKRAYYGATRVAMQVDAVLEPQLIRRNWAIPSGHAAFLFFAE
jgi:SAM-dependent methyltransferase